MENQTINLINQLQTLKVKIIDNIKEFNNIIDIEKFKLNIIDIKDKSDSIIFFDSQSYNSNIFTDNIIKFLKDFKNLTFTEFSKMLSLDNNDIKKESEFFNSYKEKISKQIDNSKIYYCNDIETFKTIFKNFYDDKEKIKSTILSFKYNEKQSSVFIDYETFNILNMRNISKVFLNLSNL